MKSLRVRAVKWVLKVKNISLLARMLGMADAFDSTISDRPYSGELGVDDPVRDLKRCAGNHFDYALVEAFVLILEITDSHDYTPTR